MNFKFFALLLIVINLFSCAQENKVREQAIKLNNEAMSYSLGKDDSISLKNSIKLLDSAIAIDSTYLLAYTNKVSLLFQLKNYEDVIKTIDKMSNFTEKSAYIFMMKGIAYKKIGFNELANSNLFEAFKISSNFKVNIDKAMYFHLLVYFESKEVALERLNELYRKGEIDENLYKNFNEVIRSMDETDVFKDF